MRQLVAQCPAHGQPWQPSELQPNTVGAHGLASLVHQPGSDGGRQAAVRVCEARLTAAVARRAARHSRQIGFGISTLIACSGDPSALIADARRFAQDPLHNVPIKALGAGLIGTPQLIADRIRRYEDMGMSLLMLQFHPFLDGLRTFADRVMPLLK